MLVTALTFSPDGQVLGIGTGEVREYEVDLRAWQQLACALAGGHDMTPDEKRKIRIDGGLTRVTCPR